MSVQNSRGIKLAMVTALVSGVSIFINKFAVGAIDSPLVFTTTKNLIVGLMLLIFVIMSGKWRKAKFLSKKETSKLLLISLIGGAIPFYMFFTGLSQISAINAALIHKTLFIWVALLAVPLLKEKISRNQLIGISLLFISNLFVGGFKGFQFSIGEFLVLGATLFWAIENIVAKKTLKNVDSDLLALARMGGGSILLILVSLISFPQSLVSVFQISFTQFFWILLTSILLLGYVSSWYRALKVAPATTVSAVLVGSTLITNILSAIFITHVWKFEMLPQALLVITGVLMVSFFSTDKKVKLSLN